MLDKLKVSMFRLSPSFFLSLCSFIYSFIHLFIHAFISSLTYMYLVQVFRSKVQFPAKSQNQLYLFVIKYIFFGKSQCFHRISNHQNYYFICKHIKVVQIYLNLNVKLNWLNMNKDHSVNYC